MHAALDRFFEELRADPDADAALLQEFEDAMAALYWDADENASSQDFYDDVVSIAGNQRLTYTERCRLMLDLMKLISKSMRPPDG
jgi:hypothetical protein